jgi:putative Ca2+/H+ antiporter (TMEM165/GDT1 family)
MRDLLAMFVTVFLAEFGDKTQLATMLFASERKLSPWAVFATFFGTIASRYLVAVPVKLIAGIGFILIGCWTVAQYYRGA